MRPLTLPLVAWLRGERAAAALDALADEPLDEQALLPLLTRLRKEYTPEQAAALVDQARLRRRAMRKFGPAARSMLFDQEALEQASDQAVAGHRAARFAGFRSVADLGCGLGGDALALSHVSPRLLLVEQDPVRLALAAHNLTVAGGAAAVEYVESDWTALPLPPDLEALFVDPARRVEGRRRFSLDQMVPPIDAVLARLPALSEIAVKVAPGVAPASVPNGCEVEFVSLDGAMREAVLWFGGFRIGATRRAAVLRSGPAGTQADLLVATGAPRAIPLSAPRTYLYEPDPAVIRATLLDRIAEGMDGHLLDPEIAYLTSDRADDGPFARRWRVIEHAPFNLKRLNRRLRALGMRVTVVKKRGAPIEPERFRRRLVGDEEGRPATLFVTRHLDQPWMILCGEEQRAAS